MSTPDENNDELIQDGQVEQDNFSSEEDEFADGDFTTQSADDFMSASGIGEDAYLQSESGETGEYQEYSEDAAEQGDSEGVDTEYAQGEGAEYAEGDYSEDPYASITEGEEGESAEGYDETAESEEEPEPEPPMSLTQRILNADRYNMILLLTLLMLTVGVVMVLIRLNDYKFNVKAKSTDEEFGVMKYIVPAEEVLSVVRNS